jgi:hypothetical protein
MELRCAKCGSEKVIPLVSVQDQGQLSDGTLRAFVGYSNPEAWVFKGTIYARLRASICGQCGHTELTAQDPGALYEAYLKTNAGRPRELPQWKVRIGEGQQEKAKRKAVYDVLRRHQVVHAAASAAAKVFHSGSRGEVALQDPQTARAVAAEFQALGIVAEVVEPQGSQEAAAGG